MSAPTSYSFPRSYVILFLGFPTFTPRASHASLFLLQPQISYLLALPPNDLFPTLTIPYSIGTVPPTPHLVPPPQISPYGSTITPQPRRYLTAPSSGLTITSTSQGSHVWICPRSRPPPASHLVAPSPVSPLSSTRSECHY